MSSSVDAGESSPLRQVKAATPEDVPSVHGDTRGSASGLDEMYMDDTAIAAHQADKFAWRKLSSPEISGTICARPQLGTKTGHTEETRDGSNFVSEGTLPLSQHLRVCHQPEHR